MITYLTASNPVSSQQSKQLPTVGTWAIWFMAVCLSPGTPPNSAFLLELRCSYAPPDEPSKQERSTTRTKSPCGCCLQQLPCLPSLSCTPVLRKSAHPFRRQQSCPAAETCVVFSLEVLQDPRTFLWGQWLLGGSPSWSESKWPFLGEPLPDQS